MTEIPRRTIADLLARYELEPDLEDIYVEGRFDMEVIESMRSKSDHNRIIYEIDTIEVSTEVLDKHNLTQGNKQRVIALARELSVLSGDVSYLCLVDKDTDHWLSKLECINRLVYTKYTSIELYFFYRECILGIIKTLGKTPIIDDDKFISSFTNVLIDLYSLRVASDEISIGLKWYPFDKYVDFKNGVVSIDIGKYAHTLILNNKAFKEENKLKLKFNEWRSKLTSDPRLCIRGHDFIDLSRIVIKKAGRTKSYSEPEAIERALVWAADKAKELSEILGDV